MIKITFTFGSEEVDCEKVAREMGIDTKINEDGNVMVDYKLSSEDIKNLDELKKLRMEDLCREFYSDPLPDETISILWQENF